MNCGYYALISSASLCGGIEKNTLHIVQGVRELLSPSPSLPPLSALLLPVSFSLTQTIQTGRWRRSYIVRLVKREFVHKTPMQAGDTDQIVILYQSLLVVYAGIKPGRKLMMQ